MANLKLDVEINAANLLKLQQFLDPKLIDKATRGGINYAAKAAKVAVGKEVGSRYNIKSARVKQDVKGPRFSQGGQMATLYLSRKPPSALQYGGKDTGRGLVIKVFKGEKAKRVTYGFIPKTGKLAGKPFRRTGPEWNAPIEFVYGPSIGSIFAGQSRFGDELRATTQLRINDQFIKGMQRVLDSAARGYGG